MIQRLYWVSITISSRKNFCLAQFIIMEIIYLRVSKEDEKLQDIKTQEKAIKDKFGIKDYKIYQERGSLIC